MLTFILHLLHFIAFSVKTGFIQRKKAQSISLTSGEKMRDDVIPIMTPKTELTKRYNKNQRQKTDKTKCIDRQLKLYHK